MGPQLTTLYRLLRLLETRVGLSAQMFRVRLALYRLAISIGRQQLARIGHKVQMLRPQVSPMSLGEALIFS